MCPTESSEVETCKKYWGLSHEMQNSISYFGKTKTPLEIYSHNKIKGFRMIFKEANLELESYPSSLALVLALALVLEDELLSYYCGFMNEEILYQRSRG